MRKILLSSVVAIALLTGCGGEKQAESKPVEEAKKVEEKSPEAKLVEQVKQSASEVAEKIVEESKKVAEATAPAVESVKEKVVAKTEELTQEIAVKTDEMTKDTVEATNESQAKIEASMDEIVATKTSTDNADKGKGLFLKCAGCHGQMGEKPALGKSQVIKGWDKDKTIMALKGYKDGSYGGVMKGVMKSQVMNLSDEEIDALGEYIASF